MRRMPRCDGEGGQMLILAGAVLVLSFLLAAFSVTELAAQEIALEQDPEGKLATTFHETREELASALQGLVIPQTTNSTLYGIFQSQKEEFEERGRAHGLFVVLGMANATDVSSVPPLAPAQQSPATQSEKIHMTTDGASSTCADSNDKYTVWSYDGARDFRTVKWDCGDDGILYDDTAGVKRIRGIAVYLFVASEAARLEENFVLALN